jgi:excisionase family DNA binding protein
MRNLRDFITIRQAADMIGVSPATLRNWDRSGKLKAARNPANRYRLYRREQIEAFLARVAPPESSPGTDRMKPPREGRDG